MALSFAERARDLRDYYAEFYILFGLIGTGVNANNTNELLVHLVSSNDTCIDVNMMATSNGCKDFSNTDTLWVIEEEIIVTNEVDGE